MNFGGFCVWLSLILTGIDCYRIVWDNSIQDVDFNNVVMMERSQTVRLPNYFFIYPGTKWCGAGNIAANDDDLGVEEAADRCCRQHDHCPDIIEGYQSKFNLTNPNFYSRLSCDCDRVFRDCLKAAMGSESPQKIGQIYFTVLGTQCFENQHPVVGCAKYTYFPKKKCVEYQFDVNGEKKYQWFDVPNF